MQDDKTHMVLSANECSRIVDGMETWMRLLNGVLTLNPNTYEQYRSLHDVQIPALKRTSWYRSPDMRRSQVQ